LGIPELSFRLFASRFVPGPNPRKQAVLGLALLFLAGCGSGGERTEARQVRGTGYVFSAPADWKVARSEGEVSVSKGIELLSVRRYPLLRAYRPALWDKVVPELDRAAEALAHQQQGMVTDEETITIAGRRARSYDVAYEHEGKKLVERLAFVLRGKVEYLLLCRYESGGDTGACDRLLTSFRLAAA
jgi:hypothetical protein